MNFIDKLKQYNLNSILEICSLYSNRLWKNEESVAKVIKYDKNPIIQGVAKKRGSTYLLPWYLADICYYSILHTNDFVDKNIDEYNFLDLYTLYQQYESKNMKIIKNMDEDDETKFFYILFGLSQKSFWYQEKINLLKTFTRLYNIMNIHSDNKMNVEFDQIIQEKYNCNLDTLFKASLYLYLLAGNIFKFNFPIQIHESLKHFNINNNILFGIIDTIKGDYSFFRDSSLEAKSLHITPILKNIKNEYIILNAFLYAKKISSFPYWFIRDRYKNIYKKEINEMFGKYFENYVDYFLAKYLPYDSYGRIKTNKKNKRADLKIETRNYQILIEQKFQILNVSNKDTIFNLKTLDRSLSELKKAASQLLITSESINSNKSHVLLVLTFDDFHIANGLMKRRIQKTIKGIDINKILFLNIEEFEALIQLLSKNEDDFNKIIETVVNRTKDDSERALDFGQVMSEFELYNNQFIADEMCTVIVIT